MTEHANTAIPVQGASTYVEPCRNPHSRYGVCVLPVGECGNRCRRVPEYGRSSAGGSE